MEIRLTLHEVWLCCQTGLMREHQASVLGSKDRFKKVPFIESMNTHILGAMGELTVAKFLKTYYGGSFNTWKTVPDLLYKDIPVEVRYRARTNYDLIIRRDDSNGSIYFLVNGEPPVMNIVGWIYGAKGKLNKYIQNYGAHGEAYFVPQSDLMPPEELLKIGENQSFVEALTT